MHHEPRRPDLIEKELTSTIIGAFYYVYNQLGYGFLEKIYSEAMARVLRKLGLKVEREVPVMIYLDGELLSVQRVDMLVESKVVVENKSTFQLAPSDHAQLNNYLAASELQVGLLLHFGPKPKFYRAVCTRSPKDFRPPESESGGVNPRESE
jgi:GxxExxY protein